MDMGFAWEVVNRSNEWIKLGIIMLVDHSSTHKAWLEQERIKDNEMDELIAKIKEPE